MVAVDIMFERIMLQEVRDNLYRIDPQSYIEIKGFYEPPRVIAEILRATIAVFKVDQVGEGEYDDWDDLKNVGHFFFLKLYFSLATFSWYKHLLHATCVLKSFKKSVCITSYLC